MEFDLDDPLGDLLSDGSNDSFFGTSKKKTKTTKPKTQASSDNKAKSKVADLFGIDTEATVKPIETPSKSNIDLNTATNQSNQRSDSNEITNPEESAKHSPTNLRRLIKRSTPERNVHQASSIATDILSKSGNMQNRSLKKETQFDDSDDFLNELGFDPKHPKGSAKKSNILDDILNFSKGESNTKPAASTPAPKSTTANETEGRASKSADTNPAVNRYSPSSRRQRNPPRTGSGGSDIDPLGLFSVSTSQTQEMKKDEISLPSTRPKLTKKPTVDWLGLDTDNEVKTENEIDSTKIEIAKPKVEFTDAHVGNNVSSAPAVSIPTAAAIIQQPIIVPNTIPITPVENISANLNMINMASLENENALQSLQQQETQLRIAAQMKQQERMLHDMHTKQQTLIKQQENQFNELLQRQIDRQNQLETQIQRQQHQISAYINVLMNQPNTGLISSGRMSVANNDENSESQKNEGDVSRQHFIELEADVKRLELEKLRLEDILQSVQSSHEQELELLHFSHK